MSKASTQLKELAQVLCSVREHVIQLLFDRYVFRTVQEIVRRNPRLQGWPRSRFSEWTHVIYAVATSTSIRRVSSATYQPHDVNFISFLDRIIRGPLILWPAFERHFPDDVRRVQQKIVTANWQEAATKRLVNEDRKLLINRATAAIEFGSKRAAHHDPGTKVSTKFFELDEAIDTLRDLSEKYWLLIYDERRDILEEMLNRKLPKGWDVIFLEPWATAQVLALPLGETPPPMK
jgi:hypothetical protein